MLLNVFPTCLLIFGSQKFISNVNNGSNIQLFQLFEMRNY